MEPYMDTLAETLRRFEERGFRAAFRAHPDGGLTVDGEEIFAPEELVVEDFARFEQAIMEVPEIVECYSTGGGIDYLLKIVALDIDHY